MLQIYVIIADENLCKKLNELEISFDSTVKNTPTWK